ncbi:MAG TPA: hypothetical protein VK149_13495 [Sideroxyarcus sp.]|nr:hypothetical protein [Sideroxyarcus sp.]
MRTYKALATMTILSCCLGYGANAAWAQVNDHSAHHATGLEHPKLNNGEKWRTDANLRRGMERIRDELMAGIDAIHNGKMSAKQYQGLAKKVNDQISFIMQNCKLDKEADTALHLVLAELVAGTDAISAAADDHSRHMGAEQILHGLQNYASHFEHPGWQVK